MPNRNGLSVGTHLHHAIFHDAKTESTVGLAGERVFAMCMLC